MAAAQRVVAGPWLDAAGRPVAGLVAGSAAWWRGALAVTAALRKKASELTRAFGDVVRANQSPASGEELQRAYAAQGRSLHFFVALSRQPLAARLQALALAPAAAEAEAAAGAAQAQVQAQAQAQAQAPYRGVRDAFASILREEGPRGLYRGLLPALLLTSHGMVQFAVYEELKARFPPPPAAGAAGGAGASPFALSASAQIFVFGAASKAAAVCVTYPSQVVKARLQQRLVDGAPAFAGLADCVRRTAQLEGVRGFYRGFAANLLRVAPQSALTLVVYEEVKRALDRLDPARA
jgi:hypothetical protein